MGTVSRWLAPLFPESGPSGRPRLVVGLGYLAGVAAVALLAMGRQSGVPAWRTLWAEDGSVFYGQAATHPFWHTLVTSYNGYLQLVPRLAGALARLFPVGDAAAVMAWGGALGLGILVAAVFHMSRAHLPSPGARCVLGLSMVLLPVAVVEMLDNFVNLPWWMYFAAFWALLWRPRGWTGRAGAFGLCALAAASEPLVGLLLPLAGARVLALPRRRENSAVWGLMVGLAYQGAIVLTAPPGQGFPASGLTSTVPAFFLRVGVGWVAGLRGTDGLLGVSRPLAELLGALVIGAVLAAVAVAGGAVARRFAAAVAVLAPLCFIVPSWLRGAGPIVRAASVGFGGRYAATSMLMVVSALLVGACGAGAVPGRQAGRGHRGGGRHARARRPRTGWVVACCLVLLPAWALDYRDWNGRSAGPTWAAQVAAARAACTTPGHARLARLETDPPGVFVVLPCSVVAGPARG